MSEQFSKEDSLPAYYHPTPTPVDIPFMITQLIVSAANLYNLYARSANDQRQLICEKLEALRRGVYGRSAHLARASLYDNNEVIVYESEEPSPTSSAYRFRVINNRLHFIGKHSFNALKGDTSDELYHATNNLQGYLYGGVITKKICDASQQPWQPYFWIKPRGRIFGELRTLGLTERFDAVMHRYQARLPLLEEPICVTDKDLQPYIEGHCFSFVETKSNEPDDLGKEAIIALDRAITFFQQAQTHDERAEALSVLIATTEECYFFFEKKIGPLMSEEDVLPFVGIVRLSFLGTATSKRENKRIVYVDPQMLKRDGTLPRYSSIIRFS